MIVETTNKNELYNTCFIGSARRRIDVSRIPSDSDLVTVALAIGYGWEMLAACLSINRTTVERIKLDYSNRTIDQIFKVLQVWKQNMGFRATFEELFKTMRECETVSVEWETLQTKLGFCFGIITVFTTLLYIR